jgi:hypothetical protein
VAVKTKISYRKHHQQRRQANESGEKRKPENSKYGIEIAENSAVEKRRKYQLISIEIV